MKNTNLKKERGITLVALVITIVVLLILAAVAIVSLTGENNIITKAQNAKDQTNQAQQQEYTELGNYENAINEWTGGNGGNGEAIIGKYHAYDGGIYMSLEFLPDGTLIGVSSETEEGLQDADAQSFTAMWNYTDGKYYVTVNGETDEAILNNDGLLLNRKMQFYRY